MLGPGLGLAWISSLMRSDSGPEVSLGNSNVLVWKVLPDPGLSPIPRSQCLLFCEVMPADAMPLG